MRCGLVWCGVAWRGVTWRGLVWRGVVWWVWCGVVWCGVVWCAVVCVFCGVVQQQKQLLISSVFEFKITLKPSGQNFVKCVKSLL